MVVSMLSRVNHVGLQHADFQAKRGGRHIIQLRAEPFEECPHEMDRSFDFERESALSWTTPPSYTNRGVSLYL